MLTLLGVMIIKNSQESSRVSGDCILGTVVEIVLYSHGASVLHELALHIRGAPTLFTLTIAINWHRHWKCLLKVKEVLQKVHYGAV